MPRRGENIYKRKDGRWEGRITLSDGGYQYFYGKSYKEAKEKKTYYIKSPILPIKKSDEVISSSSDQFEYWLKGNVRGRVKPSTYESYYCCIRKYVIPFFRKSSEKEITSLNVNNFIRSINENKELSKTYKMKIISIFKVALREILEDSDNKVVILQTVKLPKLDKSAIPVFSVKEQWLVEDEVLKTNDSRALGVLICFYTGIRLGELCALRWENVDLESGMMSIVNTVSRTKNFQDSVSKTVLAVGSPKSQDSTRVIPLPDFLKKLVGGLKKSSKSDSAYILSGTDTPVDPRTYQRLFKKLLRNAGVKDRKFHAIRHTFATRALETGVDIKTLSEILGHSNVTITLKVYAHSFMEQKNSGNR